MIKQKPPEGPPAIETIEEAIALLRRTPAATVLCSFIGGVPFWLTLLYFLADMSNDAYAEERLAGASLTLAVLYLWKKCWQTVYASGLHAVLAAEEAPPWTGGRIARMVLAQAEIQFWGLLARPLAYVLTLPSAWVSAYYQNATILGDGRDAEAESVSDRAWAQARLWPLQNHLILSILAFFLFAVWVNVAILGAAIPQLLKTLFGIETMASRNYGSYLNGTFVAATGALALMLVDPVWRAVYVVRCFHGGSLHSGADIRSRLRAIRGRAAAIAMLVVLAFSGLAPAAMNPSPVPPPPASHVDPSALDRSIEQTLERREFAWRFRRIDEPSEKKPGLIGSWLRSVKKWLGRMWDKCAGALRKFFKWLFEHLFPGQRGAPATGGHFQIPRLDSVLYAAAAIVAVLFGLIVWQRWRQRKPKVVFAQAIAVAPDLQSPDLLADQLPEAGWLDLARDLAGRGELRLALRAAYLASLAFLAEQHFVSIARHKSNRDYQRELQRRARSREALLAAFDENLAAFERAWYGDHSVTQPIFARFTENLERIRAC